MTSPLLEMHTFVLKAHMPERTGDLTPVLAGVGVKDPQGAPTASTEPSELRATLTPNCDPAGLHHVLLRPRVGEVAPLPGALTAA